MEKGQMISAVQEQKKNRTVNASAVSLGQNQTGITGIKEAAETTAILGAARTAGWKESAETAEAEDLKKEKKLMRTPRSKSYIRLMQQADQLTKQDEEIIEMVKALPVNNKLLGILAPCQIKGCIIHAIDKFGNILQHYRSVEEIPEELQEGYPVYLANKDCTSVEVYTNNFCVIHSDGIVKFVERS